MGSISGIGGVRNLFGLASLCAFGLLVFLGIGAPVAAAEETPAFPCPNEAVRAQSNVDPATGKPFSEGLPECRAYEMVSPVDKAAHDAFLVAGGAPGGAADAVAADGGAVGFGSFGVFGAPELPGLISTYVARRGENGWQTVATGPQAAYSASLDRGAYCQGATTGPTSGNNALACTVRWLSGAKLTTPLYRNLEHHSVFVPRTDIGYSADFSTFVFTGEHADPGGLQTYLSSDTLGGGLYEITGVGSGTPLLSQVNVDAAGHPIGVLMGTLNGNIEEPPALLGGMNVGTATGTTLYHAISADGQTIFFSSIPTALNGYPSTGVQTVFARVDGTTTVDVSSPQPAECTSCDPTPQPASFQGAAADGSKVFFTTAQQLLNSDTDHTVDLYEYDFEAPAGHHLVQVSGGGAGDPSPGSGAQLQGVVRTSPDGSHVYFVAKGVLTSLPNGLGQVAALGANNLYDFDTVTGSTHFVASLAATDSALWAETDNGQREAQTTPDGRYLLFVTFQALTGDDTDASQDAYRYDAATGAVIKVSPGNGPYNVAVGGVPGTTTDPSIDEKNRAISSDGQTMIFATPESLQADDTNTSASASTCNRVPSQPGAGCDLYVWRDGAVSMISDGLDPRGANTYLSPAFSGVASYQAAGMSASGNDIFFSTRTRLVPQDTDNLTDVYDARVGGGFPYSPRESCASGEACQGPSSPAAPGSAAPGSASFSGPGNQPAPPPAKKRHHRKKRHGKAHHHKTKKQRTRKAQRPGRNGGRAL